MNPVNNQFMRAVTHYDVSREQCVEAAAALAGILG